MPTPQNERLCCDYFVAGLIGLVVFALGVFLGVTLMCDEETRTQSSGDRTLVQEQMLQKENDVLWKLIQDQKREVKRDCVSKLETRGYQISHSEKRGGTR